MPVFIELKNHELKETYLLSIPSASLNNGQNPGVSLLGAGEISEASLDGLPVAVWLFLLDGLEL